MPKVKRVILCLIILIIKRAIDANAFKFDMPEGVDFDDQRGAK